MTKDIFDETLVIEYPFLQEIIAIEIDLMVIGLICKIPI